MNASGKMGAINVQVDIDRDDTRSDTEIFEQTLERIARELRTLLFTTGIVLSSRAPRIDPNTLPPSC